MTLVVSDLQMRYKGAHGVVEAVRGVSFEVQEGEFYSLLGPSGSGKTSILRCVAGLERPYGGSITAGSRVLYSSAARINVPAHRRGLGMVFQSYGVWPHMTVYENVAFPLRHGATKRSREWIRDKVDEVLTLVQLDELADRPAPLLSGGQQQRVALARALALEPAVLLLDEPLSNLDAKLREEMRQEVRRLVRRVGTTTLYVTHDQLEALTMSDRVALIHDGLIDQEGKPRDVYQSPATPFAAYFLGRSNIIDGVVVGGGGERGLGEVETPWGLVSVRLPDDAKPGVKVSIGFRPESILVNTSEPSTATPNVLSGQLNRRTFAGDNVELEIDLGGMILQARGDPYQTWTENATVYARIPAERCYCLLTSSTAPRTT